MLKKAKPARDVFAFSLGGMTAIASFVVAPAIADDRIDKIRDDRGPKSRFWLCSHCQAAPGDCA